MSGEYTRDWIPWLGKVLLSSTALAISCLGCRWYSAIWHWVIVHQLTKPPIWPQVATFSRTIVEDAWLWFRLLFHIMQYHGNDWFDQIPDFVGLRRKDEKGKWKIPIGILVQKPSTILIMSFDMTWRTILTSIFRRPGQLLMATE